MRRRVGWISAVLVSIGLTHGCGARTWNDSGELQGLSGNGGDGGFGATGAGATGGFIAPGGTGGVAGSTGGTFGGCEPPSCNCGDCWSQCACLGNDPATCDTVCFGSGGSGGAVNHCCTESAVPGCQPFEVSACVCATDSFCCTNNWDARCVREVDSLGCGVCASAGGSAGTGATGGFVGTGGIGTGGFIGSGGMGAIGGTGGFISTGGMGGVGAVGGTGGIIGTGGVGTGGGAGFCALPGQNRCEACLCSNCQAELDTCFADFGCPLILECMGRNACFGFGCYRPGVCREVIDSLDGFFGPSNVTAIRLVTCAAFSRCECN
jgi:hypothetical protein